MICAEKLWCVMWWAGRTLCCWWGVRLSWCSRLDLDMMLHVFLIGLQSSQTRWSKCWNDWCRLGKTPALLSPTTRLEYVKQFRVVAAFLRRNLLEVKMQVEANHSELWRKKCSKHLLQNNPYWCLMVDDDEQFLEEKYPTEKFSQNCLNQPIPRQTGPCVNERCACTSVLCHPL